MTHLKFFSQRLLHNEALNEVTDESLLTSLRQKHPTSDQCVDKISDFLLKIINIRYQLMKEYTLFYTSPD